MLYTMIQVWTIEMLLFGLFVFFSKTFFFKAFSVLFTPQKIMEAPLQSIQQQHKVKGYQSKPDT